MAVLRAVARPMLASIFVVQGYQTWRWPERVAARAEPVVRPVTDRVAVLPDETEQVVRLNGAVQCVAGPPIGTKAAFSDIARTKRISNRLCARAASILLIYHRGRQSALKIL